MLACSLSCRMCTRNTSLTEKAWKVRREVFMLLFTRLLSKDWLVISRNHDVGLLFFLHVNLELETELSLNFTLHLGKFKDRCVYASYKVERLRLALWTYTIIHISFFFKSFSKCHLQEAGEGRLVLCNSVVMQTQPQLGIRML